MIIVATIGLLHANESRVNVMDFVHCHDIDVIEYHDNSNKRIQMYRIYRLQSVINEPHREKTGFLPRRKQRRRSASR